MTCVESGDMIQDIYSSSDEVLRKLLKPNPTEAQIEEILRTSYVHPSKKSVIVNCKNCETQLTGAADITFASGDGTAKAAENLLNNDTDELVRIEIVHQLDSYDDCNYHVRLNEESYILKIHNGVESKDFIDCFERSGGDYYKLGYGSSVLHYQNAVLQVFSNKNIPANVVIPPYKKNTLDVLHGENQNDSPISIYSLPVLSSEHSPCRLAVRLLTWVHGRPMSTMPLMPLEALANAGRFLGKMDAAFDALSSNMDIGEQPITALAEKNALTNEAGLSEREKRMEAHLKDTSILNAAHRYHQWDGKNFMDIRPFVQYIVDEKRRLLISSILDAFNERFLMRKERQFTKDETSRFFRTGFNHGDFNDANILMDEKFQVCGVIDFGDSLESWRVLEIAVAMAYALLTAFGKDNRSISAAAAMLRGYNSVYPLQEDEKAHLFLLIMCRLACSCTLGAFAMHQNPENKYLLLHSAPAWNAIEMLWGYDEVHQAKMARAMDSVFAKACQYKHTGEAIINCSDLMFPDPNLPDLLQTVRVPHATGIRKNLTEHGIASHCKKRRHDNQYCHLASSPVIMFVTRNVKKYDETKRLLGHGNSSSLPYQLTNAKIDLPELQGDAPTIVREKCLVAAEKTGQAVIVESTSLCIKALNGMPGVFIKWFLDACGLEGLNKMIAAYDDKTAFAQTIIAFCPGPGREPVVFYGRTEGKVVMPRGDFGYGWDSIFQPDEGEDCKTYAEMSNDEKDFISHRSRAFLQLRTYLEQYNFDIARLTEES